MQIRLLRLGSYQTNCYMVWGEDSDTCILIDPGYEPDVILEEVRRAGKQVEAIALTHGHFDHIGAVKDIAAETDCKVYIHEADLGLPSQLTLGTLPATDHYKEGDILTLAGLTFRVLHTPGHTPGGVCLLCENVLFSGDTLFAGTCGRTDLPGGDYKQILKSLARLAALEEDCHVLPGHGETSVLSAEKQGNPYMQGAL